MNIKIVQDRLGSLKKEQQCIDMEILRVKQEIKDLQSNPGSINLQLDANI
jgi:hypothetical protein